MFSLLFDSLINQKQIKDNNMAKEIKFDIEGRDLLKKELIN